MLPIRTLLMLSLFSCAVCGTVMAAPQPPVSALDVQVAEGALRGTMTAGGARAWYGIPYAAPPVGARRWRAPAPPEAWDGLREARRPGPPCLQPSSDANGAVTMFGSEDCLTLNVFHPPGAIDRALPVMVWIHGGGQMYGTGASYDGTHLAMSQNVMVVTLNYRLGPMGWFHHPAITGRGAHRVTGQFALEDVIEALRWVQHNIGAFGGDADNVTLFGESAGAQNVYALLMAPSARGLFHKAIAESGGFWNMHLSQAVQPRDAVRPGTPLSAREGVASLLVRSGKAPDRRAALAYERRTSPSKLAEWLRSLSPAEVFAPYVGAAHLEFDLPSVVYDGVLLPAIDHRRLLARGGFAPVPLLIGGNRDEQKAYLWTVPLFVEGAGTHPVIRDPARYEVMNRLYSDWWTLTSVDDLLPRLRAPVYAYRFEWDDEPVAPVDLKALYGSAHGLELSFVFGDFRWGLVHDELPAEESTSVTAHPLQTLFNAGNAGSRERISEAMMAALPRLSLFCCYGTGYERVDLAAARKRGIMVTHGADANAPDRLRRARHSPGYGQRP